MATTAPLIRMPLRFDQTVKFVNDASGKDRLLRLFIYVGRLAMWALKRRGLNEAAARLKALDGCFNLTRRVLRLGKMGNLVKQCNDCYLKFWRKWAFLLVEVVKVSSGNVYLVCDHMRWLGEIGVFKSINWKRWGDWSTWCWFVGLLGSLAMDALQLRASLAREIELVHDIQESQQPHQLDQLQSSDEDEEGSDGNDPKARARREEKERERVRQLEASLKQLRQARELIYWDVAKNVWDAPLAVVGSFKLEGVPGGVLELCGTVSSLINVYLSWRAMFPPPTK